MHQIRSKIQFLFLFIPIVLYVVGTAVELTYRIQFPRIEHTIVVGANSVFFRIFYYFCYFTVVSNTMIAVWFYTLLKTLRPLGYRDVPKPNRVLKRSPAHLFFQLLTIGYIIVTMVGYHVLLRTYYHPPQLGLRITTEIFHVVLPLWALATWFVLERGHSVSIRMVFGTFFFSFLYSVFVFVLGALTNYYPYNFIDVNIVGYGQALMLALVIHIIFLFVGFGLYAVDKIPRRR